MGTKSPGHRISRHRISRPGHKISSGTESSRHKISHWAQNFSKNWTFGHKIGNLGTRCPGHRISQAQNRKWAQNLPGTRCPGHKISRHKIEAQNIWAQNLQAQNRFHPFWHLPSHQQFKFSFSIIESRLSSGCNGDIILPHCVKNPNTQFHPYFFFTLFQKSIFVEKSLFRVTGVTYFL